MLFNLFKKNIFPIGIDLGSGFLKMAQLKQNDQGLILHAAIIEEIPEDMEHGTPKWQRWVAQTLGAAVAKGKFTGKEAIAVMPPEDMFIEQLHIPRMPEKQVQEAVLKKVAKKLPFDSENAMIKQVITENKSSGEFDALVMATEREKVDRNLAIYEKAGLSIKGIGVWPIACINTYVNFFGRRHSDMGIVSLLIEIGTNRTNIIICRHSELLFARVIQFGFKQIDQGQMAQRLISEIDACVRYFESNSGHSKVQRMVFFADRNVNRTICEKMTELAKALQIPAQIGDVLAAIGVGSNGQVAVERRGPHLNWAMAFGLSLEGA
jgi:Tfp pilus assembly PilM family ATPase